LTPPLKSYRIKINNNIKFDKLIENILAESNKDLYTKDMKNKLFKIKYGNGWMGSRTNIGAVLVLAPDVETAKNIIKDKMNVKLGHIGPATQVVFLS
jgi:hypothetical protein